LELDEQIETKENMIWVPLQVIAKVLTSDNFLNPDLRSLLSVFDWDLYREAKPSPNGKIEVPEDDCLAIPANLLGKNEWKLTTLDQLTGWEIQDKGIADVSDSGVWIDMVHVSCFNREMQAWSQPLLSCSNMGLVVLLVRKIDEQYEFLLAFDTEFGISGQQTVLPSYVIYPGDNPDNIARLFENGTLLAEMTQSEEGGRFYQNESIYRVILTADDIDTAPRQRWVTARSLKSILKSSNRASLQLRCIASLILDMINPNSFDLSRPVGSAVEKDG
jgi:oxidase EvaA